jgi:hypothetical protein
LNIALVGTNPSNRSPDNSAFHPDTRSRKIIDSWFKDIQADLFFFNIHKHPTENNRPLRTSEMRLGAQRLESELNDYDKVIALGNQASKALNLIKKAHFSAPHPSGMNRKLNCPLFVQQMLLELRAFLQA